MAEVLTAFALIAVLAAVTTPAIKGRLQDGYEDAIIQELQSLASGIIAYRQDVGRYPPTLAYLMAVPATGSGPTNAKDLCGLFLSQTDSAKWNGPYITRNFPSNSASYTIAQRDAVQNSLVQLSSGFVEIQIQNVDTTTAHNVDNKIDGQNDPNNGTLRYTPSGASATLNYLIPTRVGAC